MVFISVILAWLGLSAGSFVNALVWRLHQRLSVVGGQRLDNHKTKTGQLKSENYSILNGRSMCVNCRHVLAWYDLIPLLSWLMLRGKCRYCKLPISPQYPVVELIGGLVFVSSYLLWPHTVHLNGQWLLLATWLTSSVGLLALAVYDLRWMILPNKMIYPTLVVAAAGRLAYIIFFAASPGRALLLWALSVAVASGIFYAIYSFNNKLIGFGDVRLGLVTGTLLAAPQYSLTMIFIASLLGSLAAAPALLRSKKSLTSRLPYGPFLITATAIIVIFGEPLLNWYGSVMGVN